MILRNSNLCYFNITLEAKNEIIHATSLQVGIKGISLLIDRIPINDPLTLIVKSNSGTAEVRIFVYLIWINKILGEDKYKAGFKFAKLPNDNHTKNFHLSMVK